MVKNILSHLGPLYHSYSFFGVDNQQFPGIFEKNQETKAPIIIAYIAYAISKCKKPISFTELFCADGFYTMVAERLGCYRCIGIDDGRNVYFEKANIIAELLNLKNVDFVKERITSDSVLECTDIVANIGGLHYNNKPEEILKLSYSTANKFLIVQSIISLANNDEDYFESPAPRWSWGSRYSRRSFDKMIRRNCPNVIDYHYNELVDNELESKGSVYYLIKK